MSDYDGSPLLGAHVAGWPAFVIDRVLAKHLDVYLACMRPDQRAEMDRTRRAIHAAALHYGDWLASVERNAAALLTETQGDLEEQELSTAQAAGLLDVTERRICQLAAEWAEDGLARKVGRTWLVQRDAVVLRREGRKSA